jgi:SAM-dependent methyltransferase
MKTNYWDMRFKNERAMWKYDPSESAYRAVEQFKMENINDILIPGFGYGRNAMLFLDQGFSVTGIEISRSAIELARENGIDCPIHNGSVTMMPFDKKCYQGIFCYALIHLLNKNDRRIFLKACYNQLMPGGVMIFSIASKTTSLYGSGKYISKDRYEIAKGLTAFFYDSDSVISEFSKVGMIGFEDIEEPVKFMKGEEPVKLIYVICRKQV